MSFNFNDLNQKHPVYQTFITSNFKIAELHQLICQKYQINRSTFSLILNGRCKAKPDLEKVLCDLEGELKKRCKRCN